MLKEKVMRVSDERAAKLYEEGWQYVPKSMWKEKFRKQELTESNNKKKKKKKVL